MHNIIGLLSSIRFFVSIFFSRLLDSIGFFCSFRSAVFLFFSFSIRSFVVFLFALSLSVLCVCGNLSWLVWLMRVSAIFWTASKELYRQMNVCVCTCWFTYFPWTTCRLNGNGFCKCLSTHFSFSSVLKEIVLIEVFFLSCVYREYYPCQFTTLWYRWLTFHICHTHMGTLKFGSEPCNDTARGRLLKEQIIKSIIINQ